MKILTLKTKIDLTFILIAVVFGILVWITYSQAEAVTRNRNVISETYNSNTVLEKILSGTTDIETGGRGFTITGQENFLRVYASGSAELETNLDSLEKMKRDDKSDQERILEIKSLIYRKKRFTENIIAIRKSEGMEKAARIIADGRGEQMMDSIRNKIENYQKYQLGILTAKLADTDQMVKTRNLTFALFVLVTFAIMVFAYSRIRRNANQMLVDAEIQRTLTDELAFQNQQLNDFANITSHNMRSSAANMTSLISLIEEDSKLEEYQKVFAMLRKVAGNLNESLNQLIEILRIKKNTAVAKEILAFREIFDKVTETLQGDILHHHAKVTADFSAAAEVRFSAIYLESILQNLIGNAMKYKSPQRTPEIRVSSEIQNGHVLLHVADNGLGIDLQKYGHKMFGMYQMFHKHPDAKGIGLFITRTQIENLGGKISVSSDGHSGTTFTVRFAK